MCQTFTFTWDDVVLISNAAKVLYNQFFLFDEVGSYSSTAGSPPGPNTNSAQGGYFFITLA